MNFFFIVHFGQPVEQAGSFQVAGAATEEACCLRAVDFPVACLVAGPAYH